MSEILILYASSHGQTRAIASRLAERLSELGIRSTLFDATIPGRLAPSPTRFDAVVVGSRIQYGRHAPAVIAYLRQHAAILRSMPTVFFSVSMAASKGGADPNGYLDKLFEDLGWTPGLARVIAGALPYRKYNLLLRFVMKQIAKSAGHSTDTSRNHDYTDWERVDELASEIAGFSRVAAPHAS